PGCRSTPPPDGSSNGQQITGRERLTWNQAASDTAESAALRFAVYVDGNRSELSDASCAQSTTASGLACTASLPTMTLGPHSMELATFVMTNGIVAESGRSATLHVVVVPQAAVSTATVWDMPVTTADGVPLTAERVARNLDQPMDLGFTPDGRLLVVEQR